MSTLLLTKEGHKKLEVELEDLQKKLIPAIKKRMITAREDGDLTENNPWITAKEDLEAAQIRISELKKMLKESKLVSTKKSAKVILGDRLTIKIGTQRIIISVVSTVEANPASSMVSEESPLGKALLGKEVGETVVFSTPSGDKQKATILSKE